MRFPRKSGVRKRVRARDEHRLQDGTEVKPLNGNAEVCAKEMAERTRESLVKRGAHGDGWRKRNDANRPRAATDGCPEGAVE